jgi:hypothetical protein
MTTLTRRQIMVGAAGCPGGLDVLRSHWESPEPRLPPSISSLDDGWQHHPVPCMVHVQSLKPFRVQLYCPLQNDHLTTSFGIQIFNTPGYEQMSREQLSDLYRIVKSAEFAVDPVGTMKMQQELRMASFRSYGWDV